MQAMILDDGRARHYPALMLALRRNTTCRSYSTAQLVRGGGCPVRPTRACLPCAALMREGAKRRARAA